MKKALTLSFIIFLGFSCGTEQSSKPEKPKTNFPEVFEKVLDAHGGQATWDAMNTLSYTRGNAANAEKHTIDLKTRKSLIEVENKYQLGFNGTDVWVGPHRDSFPGKSPRFMHNLHFYFVAIPFVFTDPGINIKDGGIVEVEGGKRHLINISFEANVGDTPEDKYNMYIDPATNKIDFITYSVTYFDKSRANQLYALQYDWIDANGLLAPAAYKGYKWENEAFGEQRYESVFSNVSYKKEKQPDHFYAVPAGAFIDK